MTSIPSAAARETARQLVAREVGSAGESDDAAVAIERLCSRIEANLRRTVGDDGYNALLRRVLGPTKAEHPMLSALCRENDAVKLDDVAAGASAHGVPPVTAALEALLARLLDVLGGLIGPDMALNLLELDRPPSSASRNGQRP